MLEDYVAFYLEKYLGKYVKGVSKEALKISAWQGNVELTNMQLKPEALLELKLPVKVKGGFLGSVKLKVPWSRLGQEPVIVDLDRIFVLAEPSFNVEGADDAAVQEARYQSIKEAEIAFVKGMQEQHEQSSDANNSWIGSLISTIIGNIKLSFTNIHIRYEDAESNPDQPFAAGITLEKLAAVTVDGNGKESFITNSAIDRILKSGELKRLACYFDSSCKPWDKDWENLSPSEWSRLFETGIKADPEKGGGLHQYLLEPVDGVARYNKLGVREARSPDKPAQSATVILENVTLSLAEGQYRDMLKLFDNISNFNKRVQYAHYRPNVSIKSDPTVWWKYAGKAILEQVTKASGRLDWDQLLQYARLRKKYVSLYAKLLVANPDRVSINDNEEIRNLDREVDKDVVVQWRLLAHTLADQALAQSAAHQKAKERSKTGWWPFGWGGGSDNNNEEERGLSDEEWQQLNQAIGYQEGTPSTLLPGHDPPDMLHTVLEIRMQYNATRLISSSKEQLLELSAEGLESKIKIYSAMKHFDVKLESYRVCCPEGLIAESANYVDALTVIFSYLPVEEDLDWSLSAKASPCYIKYYPATIDRIVAFFRSKQAVSREVALQTAAALQMTLEDVAKKTQKQINEALRNRPRFSLFLDIAAPKLTIPTEFSPKRGQNTQLMLDLGHFTMKTQKGEQQGISQQESEMYMCFRMELNDLSAFLVDGQFDWNSKKHSENSDTSLLPVIEKCGIVAAVQQICVPHPLYPSTRIAVRLPSLGFHISPARYHRLLQVVKLFEGSSDESDDSVRPWDPSDFEGEICVLSWQGVGNREAIWKRVYAALAGPFLYILESPSARSYEQCVSLIGKQVYSVPPETVGGVDSVIAICDPNQFSKKVVESVNALLVRFNDENTLENWRTHVLSAMHKISTSQAVAWTSQKEETEKKPSKEAEESTASEKETFFLTGALDELKICISNTKANNIDIRNVLLMEESPLLEFRALGTKVEFVVRENDMMVGAALLSLEIEDKCYGMTSPSCRYLARSTIVTDNGDSERGRRNSEEPFFDSADEFAEAISRRGSERRSSGSSQFFDADAIFHDDKSNQQPPGFARQDGLLPRDEDQRGLDVEKSRSLENFIKAQVILSSPEAPNYANIDKQVKVSLATLSIFCNRPTIVALLSFVSALNLEAEGQQPQVPSAGAGDVSSTISPADAKEDSSLPVFDRKDSVVKGLLGKGKSRVVFLLLLDMDRAQVILNNDNGTEMATLSQNNLQVTVKIFPASYGITATLGNLRITDNSLNVKNPYYWLFDMRDPAGKSLVELEFFSFNEDDDDYEGYEFSLSGKLSEVRVVYLHRFIQEISAYFMGLLPEDPGYVVKLTNKVTDVENTFTQSQVEGTPALKLDVSLSKPVIVFPKDSHSNSFLELDILHIRVTNSVQWVGGSKDDLGAVRLEMDYLKVENIHLVVSVDGKTGGNIIEDSSGLLVVVKRPLRDLWHQLPAADAEVELKLLKAGLSDKEYQVLTECCLGNLSEEPNISPPVSSRTGEKKQSSSEKSEASDTQRSHDDKVWTMVNVTVDVTMVQLALFVGRSKETPLATIQVRGAWAAYKLSTNQESYIMVSLEALSVTDDREGIEPELRMMVGNADESQNSPDRDEESPLVMLVLDARISPASQMITLRVQRPRVLLALDFLLAVAEFFIPSLADILPAGQGSSQLPHDMKNWMFLNESTFVQECEEVVLSPKHALVADDEVIDNYIYDGHGGRICLQGTAGHSEGPLIVIGHGKSLRFRNVTIKNGNLLEKCVFLGSNSAYSVSKNDGVVLEGNYDEHSSDNSSPQKKADDSSSKETTFDLQAIGPELVIHTKSAHSSQTKDRLLRAKMDLFSRLILKGDDLELNGKVSGFSIEGSRGIFVLEPLDTTFRYSSVSGKQNVHVGVSDIISNLTFSTLQLILKFQEDAQSFLRLTSKQLTVQCLEFDKIWTEKVQAGSSHISFWRPRAPPGFAVLGDCLTLVDEPLSKGVLALNMNIAHVKKPTGFQLVWSSIDSSGRTENQECRIWLPLAPPGYVSLGCVASLGTDPPSTSSVLCVLKKLVTQWHMKDCVYVKGQALQEWAFWRVDNSIGSFLPIEAFSKPFTSRPYELRYIALEIEQPEKVKSSVPSEEKQNEDEEKSLIYTSVMRFKLVWWDKGVNSRKSVSIWRPVLPPGYALLNDLAVEGYEPPGMGFVPHDSQDGDLLRKAVKFVKMGSLHNRRGLKDVTFWFPVAPPGYVALGCVATRGFTLDADIAEGIRCVRNDLVTEEQFTSPIWDSKQVKHLKQELSLWPLQILDDETGAASFLSNISHDPPPKQLAFRMKDFGNCNGSDILVGDAEVKRFSATVFDDFGGLMAPLLHFSMGSITASLHGTSDVIKASANFSVVATSFNSKHDAWEPLIEKADGFFRYNRTKFPLSDSSESQVSIAATSDMNINLSTANMNLLMEAYASWNKLSAIQSSKEETQETQTSQFLELEHERKLHVICHNSLGQQLTCRMVDENRKISMLLVPSGRSESFKMPMMMSLHNTSTEDNFSRKIMKFVALRIGEAELPEEDSFGGRQYMVAARILPHLQTADQHQLQCQSTRTRCTIPYENHESKDINLKWNEVSTFEVEEGQSYMVEIILTNFAKGLVSGHCCVNLSESEDNNARAPDGLPPWASIELNWHALHASNSDTADEEKVIGRLSLGHRFFSSETTMNVQSSEKHNKNALQPGIIEVAPSSEGPWSRLSLNFASKITYVKLGEDAVACELRTEEGTKYINIRSLVVLKNTSTVTVEACLFPRASDARNSQENAGTNDVVDEIFENERYQPVVGWGSGWPGHLLPTDPGRWSRRDLQGSSQDFPTVELPLGWEWSSDWYIERAGHVDEDGWAYGFHFKHLVDFPPDSANRKPTSFVRRRRWVRRRQRTSELESSRYVIGCLAPGESVPLPVACFREARQDYCLQLRPHSDEGYGWTKVALCRGPSQKNLPLQDLNVRALVKEMSLSSCLLEAAGTLTSTKAMWFCMDINFNAIGKDAYVGLIRDCQLIVSAPLKIVNYLPVTAEYAFLENSHLRGFRPQDKGMVSSGATAELYHTDIRKPLYLSFVPEGSWSLKKEPVLISHQFWEVARDMTLTSSSGRTVKLHIEHDYDGKEVTCKVLRISVPFWLDCSRCPPMKLKFVETRSNSKSECCLPDSDSPRISDVLDQVAYDRWENRFMMISLISPKTTAVSATLDGEYGPLSYLTDLDTPDGSVELVASDGKGSYFRLLISTMLCPLQSAHTKVICIRPYITYTNRFGTALLLKQSSGDESSNLDPSDWRVAFPVSVADNATQTLQIAMQSRWSYLFEIEREETLQLSLESDDRKKHSIRVEIRGYQEGSRFTVVFRRGSQRGPYRIENCTRQKIQYRQCESTDMDWELLHPNSTRSFAWLNPCGQRRLEVLLDDQEVTESLKLDIDKGILLSDHSSSSPSSFRVQVVQLHEVKLVRLFNEEKEEEKEVGSKSLPQPTEIMSQTMVILDIERIGFSFVDQRPQEILYLTMEKLRFSFLNSSQENTNRFKLRVGYLQLDNQNVLTSLPVVLGPESREYSGEEHVLKATLMMVSDKSEEVKSYPHVGLWVTKRAWCVNIHEPLIWTLMEMYNNLHLDCLSNKSEEVAEADPEIRIHLIDVSEARFKLTLETEPGQRPRGMLGIWSPIVSMLGNTSKMPIHLTAVTKENRYMRQSEITTSVMTHVRKDLVHQALQLLLGVNVLGMASSTLETLSKSAADLSRDGKFLKLRSKQDRLKNVSSVGDGLLRGSEALARGLAFGLTGILMKPVTSARDGGVSGFIQGVGKAAVGFVMQPISGVLDFIAFTMDGVNVSFIRCFEVFSHDGHLIRIRLPRAIRGNGILLPYDSKAALGQAYLQLAESSSFGQHVMFKEPAKYALSDFYEDHFDIPGNKVLMITNRRVMLLLRPSSPCKSVEDTTPCKILWQITYMDILSLELAKGSGGRLPSFVIIHLRDGYKTFAQVLKCHNEEQQEIFEAELIKSSIENQRRKYGPDRRTLLSQMRKWRSSLPTPRASKRVLTIEGNSDGSFEQRSSEKDDDDNSFSREVFLFEQVWRNDRESSVSCSAFAKIGSDDEASFTIWRPIVPEGYVSVGDIAYPGNNPPTVTLAYKKCEMFTPPTGFDLVWRNWKDGYSEAVSIWRARVERGYEAMGCVGVNGYMEPDVDTVWCVRSDILGDANIENSSLWEVSQPWHCFIYQIRNEALTFHAMRDPARLNNSNPKRIILPH